MSQLNVLDLFSGIGGFSLGLEAAGMRTVAFCEIEPYCKKILQRHWPGIPIFGDIFTLTADQLPQSIELICGGYPCQGESAAGKRRGAEDERWLWPEMFRIIRTCRPRWVIAENVAGHISLGFDEVAASLEAEGFTVWPFIIPASAVDAPHRRDRVWIVAYHSGHGWRAGRQRGFNSGGARESEQSLQAVADASERRRGEPHTGQIQQPGRAESFGSSQIISYANNKRCENGSPERCRDGSGSDTPEQRHKSGAHGAHGSDEIASMANAAREPQREPADEAHAIPIGRKTRDELGNSGEYIPNPIGELSQSGQQSQDTARGTEFADENSFANAHNSGCQQQRRPVSTQSQHAAFELSRGWRPEPAVGRVAHGIPNRVDRLTALGNSVVPQIPFLIGTAIMQYEREINGLV